MALTPCEASLLITGLVTIFYQLLFFFIAAYYKFDKVTDLAGGSNFVVIAIIIFCMYAVPNPSDRQIANTVLVLVWGVRLSSFLLYRVIKFETDGRFDGTRENFCKFLAFWVFQMFWVWVVSLPLTYLNSTGQNIRSDLNATDIAGLIIACIGLVIETFADQTKFNFKLDSKNKGKWCADGVWKWSRHPNYFGELSFWWGIFMSCSQSYIGVNNWAYYTILSPLFITGLLFGLSGMPILERTANERFGSNPDYIHYREDTSVLIPLPNFVYRSLPLTVKCIFLFEWPVYAAGLKPLGEQSKAGKSDVEANQVGQ